MNASQSFISDLKQKIKGDILDDSHSLGMYSTDASVYQIRPVVVVLPLDEKDVKKAVAIARDFSIKILPRGGGTSLAGQTVGEAMILDFSKYMNQVLEINPEEQWVRVQPGIVLDELNHQLKKHNLHFAPDPATASRANVGGMIGNNSSGTKSILYGKTVDHVLEARVLLADGTELQLKEHSPGDYSAIEKNGTREGEIYHQFRKIIDENRNEIKQRFPKVMRRVGGYNFDEFIHTNNWNLSKLITGSEGTLAVTLDVKLNLEPLPKYKSVVVVHFSELKQALHAVQPIVGFGPAAVEILDRTVLKMSRENLMTRHHCHFLEGNPEAILITEFYGSKPSDVEKRPQQMISKLKELGLGYAYPLFPEGKVYEDVWIVRKKGLGLMLGIKGNKKPLPFIEDAGIPLNVLPEYIQEVLAICKKYNTEVAMYAHASVGVIHVRPILDLRQEQDIQNFQHIADETFELVMKVGGSWSGEHGDGLVRSAYNERFFGTQLYNAFRELKTLFDPYNLMNPGKIVDAQPIIQNLRYGTVYTDQPVKTEYKYRQENSFRESVHMCTGVGECRKMLGGTMCPSFKATRDEEHSTRGRANALRLAMSGQLGKEGLASERLKEVLDLCLSCKACKSECPSSVDMAKMKSDVMQIYYDEHGTGLREKLIQNSSTAASRMAGKLAGLVNKVQASAPFRHALETFAGFDRRRTLPSYTSEPFYRWYESLNGSRYRSDKQVVLFADTYLNYHEPEIGKSAVKLLNDCGYEVILANVGCCQRPKISSGFLREAKKQGAGTLEGLRPYINQGLTVVVCEPSCASALNNDFPDLIDDETFASKLKQQVMMIDDFIAQEIAKGVIRKKIKSKTKDLLIHGHCHQKALYGTHACKSVISHNGSGVEEIPSGCCGMAGSFGYEKGHYEISEKIGEMELFPAVRAMNKNTTLVASGFSCRHQIEHFTGVKPKHWVEVVEVHDNGANLNE
ncbi:MAG: FAD-binding protein [Balneolaceae bacterium]|nr:FAD-binding protein [Balneolaceae bacterium]